MKAMSKAVLALAVVLAGVLAAEPALAWHHSRVRVGVGFYFGVPVAGFPYYYPPYYPYYYPPYYPTTIVVPSQPTVYVEQGSQPSAQPQLQQQPTGYWYYCGDSRAYYPYVKDCPGGWQRVSPQPPG